MHAFQRMYSKAWHDNIPHRCSIFLDDVGIKGPRTGYNKEEYYPGIRRFVMDYRSKLYHIQAICERVGATVAGLK